MANTLDTLKAVSVVPLYDTIDLSEFHPMLTGRVIRVRVNPSRAMARAISAAQSSGDNDAFVKLTAQLIPRADDTDAPLDATEFRAFLEGADDDDATFAAWLMRVIWEKVSAHFLVVMAR